MNTTTNTTTNTTKKTSLRRRATALTAACLVLVTAAACSNESNDPASAMPRTRFGGGTSERQLERSTDANSAAPALHRTDEYGNPTATEWASMYEYLEFVVKDADRYWTSLLVGAGEPEPMVNYIFPAPGESYQSACTDTNGNYVSTDDNSMFYCPADDTIYFSQSIATRLWDGTYVGPDGQQNVSGGDFVVAFLVAHEFAHSIQAELELNTAGYSVPQREKHADCWSGVWAQQAERDGLLDADDLTEGWNGAWVVGDSYTESPDHHGTGEQRQEAFWTGYTSTVAADCDVYLTN
jgi:predicted metalloprotease